MNAAEMLVERIYHDEAFARRIAPDIFPMAISYEQGKFLSRTVTKYRPDLLIELGFRYGISSLWIQSATKKPRRHSIVDPYHHIPYPPKKRTIDDFIKRQKGVFFEEQMTSQEYLAAMLRSGEKADMVFIDASQWFDSVMTDMYFVSRILRKNGIVIVRNIWSKPVRKALLFYIKNLPYSLVGFTRWETWLVKYVPIVGELVLRLHIRPLDLCVLRLTQRDNRSWNHFNGL